VLFRLELRFGDLFRRFSVISTPIIEGRRRHWFYAPLLLSSLPVDKNRRNNETHNLYHVHLVYVAKLKGADAEATVEGAS